MTWFRSAVGLTSSVSIFLRGSDGRRSVNLALSRIMQCPADKRAAAAPASSVRTALNSSGSVIVAFDTPRGRPFARIMISSPSSCTARRLRPGAIRRNGDRAFTRDVIDALLTEKVMRIAVRHADIRGAARLATDATAGLADLIEAMHERIARIPGLGGAIDGRVGGISGLVYKSVRGVTRVVGGSIDALLALLGPALSADGTSPEREAIIAALNGVLGDHLAASGNPLAIPMALRRDGRALILERDALAARLPEATSRVVVLLHGLCMSDVQWSRAGHDHGRSLAHDLGFTPVYLHYNSGLHISTNGRTLAAQLEQLIGQWPQPLQRLVLVGHSMGGLVARSAMHCADQAGQRWPQRVSDVVFLGTPHHGAPFERMGNWVTVALGATPYAAPFARLGKLRSAGITDLRHGNLRDEDWVGHDRFAHRTDRRRPLPLPEGVRCFALAATTGARTGDRKDRLIGDGLVPLDSALGRHASRGRSLAIPVERQWIGYGMNHLDLLSHPEVYAKMHQWLS
jgi:pimeloyl-ACP methyl ester carboxylesterase